mmetsp:Transcript_142172/g.246253  ORF Transcript_142172/g.246253 Transcript_142172/m.246253 type:complete len:205 (+) Transcript_142172:53-667(+)
MFPSKACQILQQNAVGFQPLAPRSVLNQLQATDTPVFVFCAVRPMGHTCTVVRLHMHFKKWAAWKHCFRAIRHGFQLFLTGQQLALHFADALRQCLNFLVCHLALQVPQGPCIRTGPFCHDFGHNLTSHPSALVSVAAHCWARVIVPLALVLMGMLFNLDHRFDDLRVWITALRNFAAHKCLCLLSRDDSNGCSKNHSELHGDK